MLDYAISMKYMLAGYTIIVSVLLVYIISLIVRWRNLNKVLHTMKDIHKID
jgi:hypothetical protein